MAFIEGENIKLRATFTNEAGDPEDPANPVTVTVKAPDGTKIVDEEEATKESTGVYTYIVTTTIYGKYYYRFKTGGNSIEIESFEMGADNTEF